MVKMRNDALKLGMECLEESMEKPKEADGGANLKTSKIRYLPWNWKIS